MTQLSTLIVAHQAVAAVEDGETSKTTHFDKDNDHDAPRAVEDGRLA